MILRLVHALAAWCAARSRVRVIADHLDPSLDYLSRHYLVGHEGSQWFAVFLHRFHRSDEAVLHDHPWAWISVPLVGGYFEHDLRGQRIWRGPFSIRLRLPSTLHRVEMAGGTPEVWTLFISFPRWRKWGFWMPLAEFAMDPAVLMIDHGAVRFDERNGTLGVWIRYDAYLATKQAAHGGAVRGLA